MLNLLIRIEHNSYRQALQELIGSHLHRNLQRRAPHVQGANGPLSNPSVRVKLPQDVVDGEPLVDPLVFPGNDLLLEEIKSFGLRVQQEPLS